MAAQRIAILSMNPWSAPGSYQPFSYAAYCIQAALITDPALAGADVRVFDSADWTVDSWVEQVEQLDPEVVGVSAYMWGLPTFVEVTRRLKQSRPDRTIIFGGPSARPANLRLEPYAGCGEWIDALVLYEGEDTVRELVALHGRGRAAWQQVAGLALPAGDGWRLTAPRPPITDLDRLKSPFQLGLAPAGVSGSLETFRGCPFACSFCQWGALGQRCEVFSREHLAAELRALQERGAPSVFLLDPALNLNAKAFRNLAAAEAEVGFIRSTGLICEVYPLRLREAHLELLGSTRATVGIGLQSLSTELLARHGRPFKLAHFSRAVERLSEVAQTTVEIILGIPGDSPAQFLETFERVRRLPCSLRVYHCLVLPDALLDRAPPSYELSFDPITLEMRSCLGWSADDLRRTADHLSSIAARDGGIHTRLWPDPVGEQPDPPELGKPVGVSLWMFPNQAHEEHHRHRPRGGDGEPPA